jgi:hypothetical protein
MVFLFFQIHNEIMFHFVLFLVDFSKVAIFLVEKTQFKLFSQSFSQYSENSP